MTAVRSEPIKPLPIERIRVVSATRASEEEFKASLLARSLQRLAYDPRIVADVTFSNSQGLPSVYNRAIRSARVGEALVFVHDDLFIDDFNLFVRLLEALQQFDLVGVAGNANPHPAHVSWFYFRDGQKELKQQDRRSLSGVVAHGEVGAPDVWAYGLTPRPCVLLDGCFLAASGKVLLDHEMFFDERFKFHFYDLDFCRTAACDGMRVGTWPIAVTHKSVGSFGSTDWERSLEEYQRKW
jgi:hypothetical protein